MSSVSSGLIQTTGRRECTSTLRQYLKIMSTMNLVFPAPDEPIHVIVPGQSSFFRGKFNSNRSSAVSPRYISLFKYRSNRSRTFQ